jgi:hypothetical protein
MPFGELEQRFVWNNCNRGAGKRRHVVICRFGQQRPEAAEVASDTKRDNLTRAVRQQQVFGGKTIDHQTAFAGSLARRENIVVWLNHACPGDNSLQSVPLLGAQSAETLKLGEAVA